MPAVLDLQCSTCNEIIPDYLISSIPAWSTATLIHLGCGGRLEILWRARRRQNAQWGDRDTCVVFRDGNGNVRYPGRNDVQPPPGFEKVEIRSLYALDSFSKEHNVRNEICGYRRGDDGEGFTFEPEPVAKPNWTPWNELVKEGVVGG